MMEEYPNFRELIEDNRNVLVKTLDITQFFAVLRTQSIFNIEDEQSITQNVNLSTNVQKASFFLDRLVTRGPMGFKVFLGILETRYPDLYKQLSGKDPVAQPESEVVPSIGDTCEQHKKYIQQIAVESVEMASKLEAYKKEVEFLKHKLGETQRNNSILKTKHHKYLKKLQRYEALQHTLKMRQHELNDLTTQQRNILAKSLQLQQEKEAIERKLRNSDVEIKDLQQQLSQAQAHHKRKSQILQSTRRTDAMPVRSASVDSARCMELEIERLRRELLAYQNSTDVDIEVTILRDDLREKTAECEHLAEEWQRTQKELNIAEEERIAAVSELEDVRYACQNFQRETARYKQLYELNIKHSDRTEEDLKKAREDRNSLETHVDSLIREQRDLLYRLQDLQNKNMNLSHDNSVLQKALKDATPRREKGATPDLGYSGGSQSESSKEGSPRNSLEDPKSSLTPAESSSTSNLNKRLHLKITNASIDQSQPAKFRNRAMAIGASSPIACLPSRVRESANIYATLQRQQESIELDKHDSIQLSSCSSIESSSDQENGSVDSSGVKKTHRLERQRKAHASMEAVAGSKRNRFTLTCFGGPSLAIDEEVNANTEDIKHHQKNLSEDETDDDDEDAYDYPEVYKRRSMSLTDIHILPDNYDFVENLKPNKNRAQKNSKLDRFLSELTN